MADPGFIGPRARPTQAGRFVDHVVDLVIDHVCGGGGAPWRFGPLVLISPDETAASASLAARISDTGRTPFPGAATVCSGTTLDRDIAAALADDRVERFAASLASFRLVVVDRIDHIADVERQAALVHLLDTVAAAGGIWMASLPVHPTTCFMPQCGSRLTGGLVVPLGGTVADLEIPSATAISLRRIIRAASRLHDVPITAVVGPSRHRSVVAARSLAMYLARKLTGRSLQAIGTACGGRDHTTVLHGVRVCGTRLTRDHAFAADVAKLAADLLAREPAAEPRRPDVDSPPLSRLQGNRRGGRRHPA